MNLSKALLRALCAAALVPLPLPAQALKNVPEPTPLSRTVSIGDVLLAQDQKARSASQAAVGPVAITSALTGAAGSPVHLIYIHGVNDIGPDDSAMLRRAICRYTGECTVRTEPPMYAEGPFALNAPIPALTYLQQPIWLTQQEWNASAPFIVRYRISGNGHSPIVLDELNWYPLVYPLKCKFLLPGDAKLTGSVRDRKSVCLPSADQPDPNSPGHFLAYRWLANVPLFTTDLPNQHATVVNRSLKVNVMDWGFGDAVIALGPMREILTAAVRQLLAESLTNLVPGDKSITDEEDIPVFFVTHSLGSYLALTAMDSAWLGSAPTDVTGFDMTTTQTTAVDFFARHTTGFYFLANQIGLLELARIAPPDPAAQPNCSRVATSAVRDSPEPAAAALSHYGCMRHNYLATHPAAGPAGTGPQIIAWSAADDILSWYVPAITGVAVVNLPAHNSGFRIPWLIASPLGAHDNYAINPSIGRQIFNPTKH